MRIWNHLRRPALYTTPSAKGVITVPASVRFGSERRGFDKAACYRRLLEVNDFTAISPDRCLREMCLRSLRSTRSRPRYGRNRRCLILISALRFPPLAISRRPVRCAASISQVHAQGYTAHDYLPDPAVAIISFSRHRQLFGH